MEDERKREREREREREKIEREREKRRNSTQLFVWWWCNGLAILDSLLVVLSSVYSERGTTRENTANVQNTQYSIL
jgi:hypothetical protein